MTYFIGIDIGGTFTDCAVLEASGRIATIAKSPTRRGDPDRGVLEAVEAAARQLGLPPQALLGDCHFFIHGCTVATNAVVERKGVRTALVTTRGHEDAIFIGKASQKVAGLSQRQMAHQSHLDKADPPIVPRRLVIGVNERIDSRGDVVVALGEEEIARVVDLVRKADVEAVAISLLWCFANPVHEARLKAAIVAALPGVFVCASHELVPLLGEYERTSTTVTNAYVGPKVTGYVERLEVGLAERGYRYPMLLAHCMGGLTTMQEIQARPLMTFDSGPVSGVLGAKFFGTVYGEPNIICADMGGTTFDVAIIENGAYTLEDEPVIDRYVCLIPKVAVESIGAGGGSVLWVDENGLPRVGPRSAGADPGPACYGAGGTEPTITDVNIVLGYLSGASFLGGRMRVDPSLSEAAVDRVAEKLGLDRTATAAGAYTIVNAHMADLMRRTSIDRGRDPREFVLFAYGGAGALHIAYLARELGISKVYIPSFATVFSAMGMLTGGILHSAEQSFAAPLPLDVPRRKRLAEIYRELEAMVTELFDKEEVAPADRRFRRFAYVKYKLQPRALAVEVDGPPDAPDVADRIAGAFEARYQALYGRDVGYRRAGIEIVKCRVDGSAQTVMPDLAPEAESGPADAETARKGTRRAYFAESGGFIPCPVYDGDRFVPGTTLQGPAIVERMGDTIVVPPFVSAEVDRFRNVVLHVALGGSEANR